MPPSKPIGFNGGTFLPSLKSETNSPLLFLSEKKSLMTSSTKFFSRHRYITNFIPIYLFYSSTFLTLALSLNIVGERGEAENTSFENECSIDIDLISTEDILHTANFFKHWKLILWNKAFRMYSNGKRDLKFIKELDFLEFEEGPIAIKRIAYL